MDWGDLEETIRFHFTFAEVPKKHKPVEIKTNRLHSPSHPAFFPGCQLITAVPLPPEAGTLTHHSEAPSLRTPSPAIPERLNVAPTAGSVLCKKRNRSFGLMELLSTPEHLNYTTVWLTSVTSTRGNITGEIINSLTWQAWRDALGQFSLFFELLDYVFRKENSRKWQTLASSSSLVSEKDLKVWGMTFAHLRIWVSARSHPQTLLLTAWIQLKFQSVQKSYFLNCLRNIPMFMLRFASKIVIWKKIRDT